MDNLHGAGETMATLFRAAGRKNKVHSMENLDCSINNGRCRSIARPETDAVEDCHDALATQWMRDWQVLNQAHSG